MISSAKLAALTNTVASEAAAPVAQEPATPFDTILTLESLAASCTTLETLFMGVETAESCGAELSLTEPDDADDADATDDEDPVEFLAELLSAAAVVPRPAPRAQAVNAPESSLDESVGDASTGGHARHATADADAAVLVTAQPAITHVPVATAGVSVDPSIQKLLVAGDPPQAANSQASATGIDTTQSPEAVTAGLARAAEMLAHGPRHAAPMPKDYIPTPVRDPNWAQDLGARVAMMVRGAESTASLQLAPQELGPVDINVVVKDSQATIHFGAAHAETRALIEASIPKLREMLAAQGFSLMDASVSQGFARQARNDVPTRIQGEPEVDAEVRTITHVNAAGILDLYA